MQLGKGDVNESVSGLRKLIQDLIAPELGSIKATQAAHGEQLSLIRAEIKATEGRSEQNFQLIRDEMKATEERGRAAQNDLEEKLINRIEFARSEAQHSTNEIKLLIGLNYEQRKREEAEARVAELERRLQLQPPS